MFSLPLPENLTKHKETLPSSPAEIGRRCQCNQDVSGRQDEDPQGQGGAVEGQRQRSSQ